MPHSNLIHLSDLHIGLRKKESDQTRSVIRKISSPVGQWLKKGWPRTGRECPSYFSNGSHAVTSATT